MKRKPSGRRYVFGLRLQQFGERIRWTWLIRLAYRIKDKALK